MGNVRKDNLLKKIKLLKSSNKKIYVRFDSNESKQIFMSKDPNSINLLFRSNKVDLTPFTNTKIGLANSVEDSLHELEAVYVDFDILEKITGQDRSKQAKRFITNFGLRTYNFVEGLLKYDSTLKSLDKIKNLKIDFKFSKDNIFISNKSQLQSFCRNPQLYVNKFFFDIVKIPGMYDKYKSQIDILCDMNFYKMHPNVPGLKSILKLNIETSVDSYVKDYLKIQKEYKQKLEDLDKELSLKVSYAKGDKITDGIRSIIVNSVDIEMNVHDIKHITYRGQDLCKRSIKEETIMIDNDPDNSNIHLLL